MPEIALDAKDNDSEWTISGKFKEGYTVKNFSDDMVVEPAENLNLLQLKDKIQTKITEHANKPVNNDSRNGKS